MTEVLIAGVTHTRAYTHFLPFYFCIYQKNDRSANCWCNTHALPSFLFCIYQKVTEVPIAGVTQ